MNAKIIRTIPSANGIGAFFHCGQCIQELPDGMSPREYAQLEVGFTKMGLQVWCKRHEVNVIHLDFAGQKFATNTTTEPLSYVRGEDGGLEMVDVLLETENTVKPDMRCGVCNEKLVFENGSYRHAGPMMDRHGAWAVEPWEEEA